MKVGGVGRGDGGSTDIMASPREWLQRKLNEPCACSSGRPYRKCCVRKEAFYFLISAVATVLLLGYRHMGVIRVVVVLILSAAAGVLVNRHFKQSGHDDEKR